MVVRTVAFTIAAVAMKTVVGLILALAMNESFKGRTLLRGIFLLPWILADLHRRAGVSLAAGRSDRRREPGIDDDGHHRQQHPLPGAEVRRPSRRSSSC